MADPSSKEAADVGKLVLTYKRGGGFDEKKKAILQEFPHTPQYHQLMQLVKIIVDNEISRDPSLLLKNRGQLAALIEGSILRSPDSIKRASIIGTSPTQPTPQAVSDQGSAAGTDKDISADEILENPNKAYDNTQISSVISKLIEDIAIGSTVKSSQLQDNIRQSLSAIANGSK